ncbi:MAG: hypothetical protein KJZ78_21265 [Bryobacteraceae bacterium]|nr:hypothetical protein [Bryobacteraceae bacterium]
MILILGFGVTASAGVILIKDGFSSATGESVVLTGTLPDTATVEGRTWTTFGYVGSRPNFDMLKGKPAPGADTSQSGAAAINIQNGGAYVKPSILTISADVAINGLAGNGQKYRGVGLGFFSATSSLSEPQTDFTGLTLSPEGNLSLAQGTTIGSNVSFPSGVLGAFSTTALYNLSYTIDTVTGGISSVFLSNGINSVDLSSSFSTNLFTGAATNFAGFYGSSAVDFGGGRNEVGLVDNFTVSMVPEPGTVLLGVMGFAGVACAGRRRRARCL